MPTVAVEVLYFDGCPNYQALVAHIRDVFRDASVRAEIELRRVPDEAAAKAERFLGSPTVRIDGRDVEPGADRRTDFGLTCRFYRTARGFSGVPDDAWIRARVRDALDRP
jgi:hypothetical protein